MKPATTSSAPPEQWIAIHRFDPWDLPNSPAGARRGRGEEKRKPRRTWLFLLILLAGGAAIVALDRNAEESAARD